MTTNTDVYALGDIHGNWNVIASLCRSIRNSVIISVGDYGIGFCQNKAKEARIHNNINDILFATNNNLVVVRGNHDDPSYFKKETALQLSHIEFVEDYTVKEYNGFKILLVGGAISVDRHKRKEGVSYWKDEALIYDQNKVTSCDILITHTAPPWIGPFDKLGLIDSIEKYPELWDLCVQERRDVGKLIEQCGAKKHYCGHFHTWSQIEHNGCLSRILDIDEVVNIIRAEETK
jgi:predicted phosphodiesterase